jgi:hypothetical protein
MIDKKQFLNKYRQIKRFLLSKTNIFSHKKTQLFSKRQYKISIIVIAVLVVFSTALFSFDVFSQQANTAVLDMRLAADNYDPATKAFTDRSGNNNDGVSTNNAVFETGRHGSVDGSMSFNGSSDYIDLGDYKYLSDKGWTVLAWIKVDQHKNWNNIVGAGYPSNGYVRPGSYISTNASGYLCDYTGTNGFFCSNTALSTDSWHLVGYQLKSDNTYNFYLDGSLDGSYTVNPENYNGQFIIRYIGQFGGGVGRFFNGTIDRVHVYNYTLTDQEVQNMYESEKVNFSASSLQKGLIGHWTLDGVGYNANINEVVDRSGRSNQGTNYGAVLTTDRMEKLEGAMSFDGVDDYIDLTNSFWHGKFTNLAGNFDNFSISAWIKLNSYPLEYSTIVGQRFGDTMAFGVTPSGNIYLNMDDTRTSSPKNNTSLELNKWYHVSVLFNGTGDASSTATFYINGIQDGSGVAWDGNGSSDQHYLFIGKQGRAGIGADSYFSGSINDLRIYNRLLSTSEISSLSDSYNLKLSSGSLQKGLVLDMPLNLKYTLDETTGSEIMADKTPYSNDGQNYGATITEGGAEFDGVNMNRIAIPGVDKMNNFSLSIWAYNQSGGDSRHSILRNYWEIVGTQICFWSYDFANAYWRCSPSGVVPYDQWTHITTTWDGSRIRHYTNGNLVWTDSSTSSGTNQNFYSIGGYSGRQLKGKFSNLKVHNRTLSEIEVKSLYDKGRGGSNIIINPN